MIFLRLSHCSPLARKPLAGTGNFTLIIPKQMKNNRALTAPPGSSEVLVSLPSPCKQYVLFFPALSFLCGSILFCNSYFCSQSHSSSTVGWGLASAQVKCQRNSSSLIICHFALRWSQYPFPNKTKVPFPIFRNLLLKRLHLENRISDLLAEYFTWAPILWSSSV